MNRPQVHGTNSQQPLYHKLEMYCPTACCSSDVLWLIGWIRIDSVGPGCNRYLDADYRTTECPWNWSFFVLSDSVLAISQFAYLISLNTVVDPLLTLAFFSFSCHHPNHQGSFRCLWENIRASMSVLHSQWAFAPQGIFSIAKRAGHNTPHSQAECCYILPSHARRILTPCTHMEAGPTDFSGSLQI